MSTGLPYLHKLRKSQLAEFAEATDLQDYDDYTKPELVTALDEHLRANRSIFANHPQLADYYKRLSQPPRASPIKREPKVEATPPVESTPKSTRGRRTRAKEEVEPTDDEGSVQEHDKSPTVQVHTPARQALSIQLPLPPSPAVVTDAIDRQTAAWHKNINDAWTQSGVQELSNALRAALSSVCAIESLLLALEGFSIIKEILPLRYLTTVPAVQAIHSPEFAIKVPDLFVLVDGAFWAPFSLWLLTSLILPLTVAYFFNISLHVTSSGGPAYNTRRGRATPVNFDPLSFNIAKALIAYIVYANHFTFWNLYSNFSIEKVNVSVPGQWAGIVTGAAIGLIGTLYEAILRK